MHRITFAALLLWLMIAPAQAQEAHRLREPDVTELLRFAAENISCDWDSQWEPRSSSAWNLCGYLIDKIEQNYYTDELANLPYAVLAAAYDALQPGTAWDSPGRTDLWHEALIMAWLRDNDDVDLEQATEFTVAHMTINVKPRDFDADGVDEFVLEVESPSFAGFLVFSRELDNTYERVSMWLPYHDPTAPYLIDFANRLHEIAFEDFNADGLPEWFVAYDGASYSGTYLGKMYLLSWRDGELNTVSSFYEVPGFTARPVDLTDNNREEGFIFENLDDDPALELRRVEIRTDIWRCQQTDSTGYDWDQTTDTYVQIVHNLQRSDTANCVMMDAENALYALNYTAAQYLYEYALTLPLAHSDYEDAAQFDAEMRQFIQLRLAQTLLLSGDYAAANALLDEIEAQDMASEMVRKMRDVLTAHRSEPPQKLCTALYNLFEEAARYSYYQYNFQEHIDTQLFIGRPEWSDDVSPAFAGCNIPQIIDLFLARDMYIDRAAPYQQLGGIGVPVSETLHADFDGDGKLDWLAWYEANVDAVLLMNPGDSERLTVSARVDIQQPDKYVSIETFELPGEAGTAIILYHAEEGLPSTYSGYTCPEGVAVLGRLELWHYIDEKLIHAETSKWCADRPSVSELVANVNGEDAFYMRGPQGEPVAYVWDTDMGRYMPPIIDQYNDYKYRIPEPTPSNEALYHEESLTNYFTRLDQQMGEAANTPAQIAIIDAELDAPYMEYPYPLLFWKATILEAADDDRGALAEYVALANLAPDSMWGKLAALYFEPVD